MACLHDYYDSLKKELMAKREGIRSLTLQSKIQGDYHEALVRDFVRRFVPQRFEVGYGIVFDEKMQKSRECDVIVYETRERRPLFKSQDLIIVDSESVKIVIQVKGMLTSSALRHATENLKAVKKLNRGIMCWIVGFETNVLLKTLYLNAWRSGAVQFLHIFQSRDRKTENQELLMSQMRFFVDLLRHYTEIGIMEAQGLTLYNDGEKRFALQQNADEQKIREVLSDIYRDGFWKLFDSGYDTYEVFSGPSG